MSRLAERYKRLLLMQLLTKLPIRGKPRIPTETGQWNEEHDPWRWRDEGYAPEPAGYITPQAMAPGEAWGSGGTLAFSGLDIPRRLSGSDYPRSWDETRWGPSFRSSVPPPRSMPEIMASVNANTQAEMGEPPGSIGIDALVSGLSSAVSPILSSRSRSMPTPEERWERQLPQPIDTGAPSGWAEEAQPQTMKPLAAIPEGPSLWDNYDKSFMTAMHSGDPDQIQGFINSTKVW